MLRHVTPALLPLPCSRAVSAPASRAAELAERWSFVGAEATERWLWHALDHRTGKVLAYVVGLGNTASPPDTNLLRRIANTNNSSYYNSAYPAGDMIYATNNDELHAAFARLASEILRITM